MKLIVGLGNPGLQYQNTKHNIGFDIIDNIAKEHNIIKFKDKFLGNIAELIVSGEKIILLKPMTYMNLSGNSIKEVIDFYKLDANSDLIVIYDDMDIELGKLKLKKKGSSGGHNGLKSIISHLGREFIRIKCGIGKPKSGENIINFVTSKFSKTDRTDLIEPLIEKATKAIKLFMSGEKTDIIIEKFNKKL